MLKRRINFKANCQICKRPAIWCASLKTGWHVYLCADHKNGISKEVAEMDRNIYFYGKNGISKKEGA